MSTPAELAATLLAALTDPQRVRADNVDVTQPTLTEQIALAKFLTASAATADPRKAITFVKIVPPGSA
jgi:hypothetical protein